MQNFYTRNQKVMFNQKLYFLWLVKNIPYMILSIVSSVTDADTCFNYSKSRVLWGRLFRTFFHAGFPRRFKRSFRNWHPIHGGSYARGVEYWSFRSGLNLLENKNPQYFVKPLSENHFFNQYYHATAISTISLHYKFYRVVLMNCLQLTLGLWQAWPVSHTISYRFVLMIRKFYLLRFYNKVYFKVQNL